MGELRSGDQGLFVESFVKQIQAHLYQEANRKHCAEPFKDVAVKLPFFQIQVLDKRRMILLLRYFTACVLWATVAWSFHSIGACGGKSDSAVRECTGFLIK